MNLTIHSIGDIAFLSQVMNGIAMIGGTQDLRTAAGIGALVGVLFQALRGLMDPTRGLRPSEFLASLLLWMALFQPTASVTLEDAYSKEVRVVAHVPLGPAVAGSLISNLGYGLTVLFETAFSTPSMTRFGYGGSLETLTAVRRNLLSRLSIGKALNPTPSNDAALTVSQYVRDCTLTGVDLGVIPIATLLNAGDLPGAFRFDSSIYVTEVRDGSLPLLATCTDAWPRLEQQVRGDILPRLTRQLGQFMKQDAGDPTQIIQSSLDALTQGQAAASQFILAAALVPMFEQGVIGRHQDSLKATEAAMVETAIAQRNSQWAAEQSMFTRIVRPMLTWIEGFSYAITPFMTFTIFLGSRGIQMCGQYVLMLIWIQFWMPVLAIGNLYITLATQGGFSALRKAGFAIDSVAGLYQIDMELQNWIAIGGMLASATPAIALMLVYGGSVTATHFLGRMQGGDFVDEKIGSPALLQSPPLIGMEPHHRHAPLTGVALSGAEHILPTFSLSQEQSASTSLTQSRREQRAETFMQSLRSQSGQSHSLSEEAGTTENLSERLSAGGSRTDRFLEATGDGLSRQYRESGISGHDFSTLLGGTLTGRIGGTSRGAAGSSESPETETLQGGLQAQLQDRFHLADGRAREIASDLTHRIGEDVSFQSDLAEAISHDLSEGHRQIGSLGLRTEDMGEIGSQASALVQADIAHQDAITHQRRAGSDVHIGALEAGMRIQSLPGQRDALDRSLDTVGLRGDAVRLGSIWHQEGLINDPGQAYAAAGLSLLSGHSQGVLHPVSGEEATLAQTLGRIVLGEAFNAPYVAGDLDISDRQLVEAEPPPFETVRKRVSDGLDATSTPERDDIIDRSDHTFRASRDRIDDAGHAVSSASDAFKEGLNRATGSRRERFDGERRASLSDSIDRAAATPAPSEWIDRTAGAFLRSLGTRLNVLGEGGIETLASLMHDARDQNLGPFETLKMLSEKGPGMLEGEILHLVKDQTAWVEKDLTPTQRDYYQAALIECFGGLPMTGDYQMAFGDLGGARAALDQEYGEKAPAIAAILRKMTTGGRSDLLELLRSYNGTGSRDID